MIRLEVRFLTGRFHGNRWQSAHNEGVAEWPPSAWRLLRALVSAAYDLGVEAHARPLIEKLGVEPPSHQLPAARQAHTRHYMPDVEDTKHKKTKVFDTFVAVDGGTFLSEPHAMKGATSWESVTPFVPTRHPKTVRGSDVDDIPSQVRRGCAQLGLPEPVSVESLDGEWHKFRRRRRRRDGRGRRGADRAHGLRLVFSKPVRGPIVLGYGAHFGLGLFTAVEEPDHP